MNVKKSANHKHLSINSANKKRQMFDSREMNNWGQINIIYVDLTPIIGKGLANLVACRAKNSNRRPS